MITSQVKNLTIIYIILCLLPVFLILRKVTNSMLNIGQFHHTSLYMFTSLSETKFLFKKKTVNKRSLYDQY